MEEKKMEWYVEALKKYADFSGRARRKEYWMFTLCNVIIAMLVAFVSNLVLGSNILSSIYSLALLLPSWAICVRRLHDIGKSGWWFFISLIPLVGSIWLIILFCKEGELGTNQYGPNPKA